MKIIMLMAVTADGKIAKNVSHFPDWTSEEDKKIFFQESMKAGVVIMGGRTFDTFIAPLKDRLNAVVTLDKEHKNTPKNVKIYYKRSPRFVKADLAKLGYKKAILGGGAFMNGLFLKNKLVDEIIIIIAPKLFGQGLALTDGFAFDYNLKLLDNHKINRDSILIRYKVLY